MISVLSASLVPARGANFEGTGKVIDHRIQKPLDTLVFKSGPTHHGNQFSSNSGPANRRLDIGRGDLLFIEKLEPQLIVRIHQQLDQLFPGRFRDGKLFVVEIAQLVGGTQLIAVQVGHRLAD